MIGFSWMVIREDVNHWWLNHSDVCRYYLIRCLGASGSRESRWHAGSLEHHRRYCVWVVGLNEMVVWSGGVDMGRHRDEDGWVKFL